MGRSDESLQILLVDNDAHLVLEVEGFNYPGIEVVTETATGALDPVRINGSFDVVALNIDLPGGLELLADLCAGPDAVPVVALAACGVMGRTLENTLTIAELRGAAIAMPKPIDAVEFAIVCIEASARRRPWNPEMRAVVADLERRLSC